MKTHTRILPAFSLGTLLTLAFFPTLPAAPLVRPGETIAFMGDSITQQGAGNSTGYVNLVESGLQANGIDVKVIGAGISGHKSNQMRDRLQSDVLDKKPAWMTLSCGVNDVWHGAAGVPLDDYKKNITSIVDRCRDAGVKAVILTSTPIQESDNENNQKLAGYNAFLKELAAERKLPLADLNAAIWAELNTPTQPRPPGNSLTADGTHMNPLGDEIMAIGVLKAFGLNATQLAKAREAWLTRPTSINTSCQLTLAEYKKLTAIAAEQKKTLDTLVNETVSATLKNLAAAKPATP